MCECSLAKCLLMYQRAAVARQQLWEALKLEHEVAGLFQLIWCSEREIIPCKNNDAHTLLVLLHASDTSRNGASEAHTATAAFLPILYSHSNRHAASAS